MKRYNLIDEPWISIVLNEKGQTKEVSLNSLFKNAHKFKRIAGDTVTQDFAVLRVILAILHTVFSRFNSLGEPYGYFDLDHRYRPITSIDEDDLEEYESDLMQTWKKLWFSGEFPEIVNHYLEKWSDRFNLLDNEYPFFQVTKTEVAPDKISKDAPSAISGKNINRLVSESRNKLALFSPKTPNKKELLSKSECARWLLTFQGYTGLSDKVIFGKEKYKSSKGWLFDIGGIVIEGNNLFETLMLNLVLLHPESEYRTMEQKPCWEYDASEMIEHYFSKVDHDNLAALYTNWSRAIYIDPNTDFEKPFECHIVKLPDIKHADNFLEPMTIWQYNKKGENRGAFTPRKHQMNQSIWRSFGLFSMKSSTGREQRQPGIVDWVNSVSAIIGDKDLTIRAVSMKDDNNATSWVPVDEITDQLCINDIILADVKESGWVPRINDAVEKTKEIVERSNKNFYRNAYSFREFLEDINKIRNNKSGSFVNEEIEKLYFQLNYPFNHWLSALRPCDPKDDRIFEWENILKDILFRQVEQILNNAGPRDYTGIVEGDKRVKNIATIYNKFIRSINLQLGEKGESKDASKTD